MANTSSYEEMAPLVEFDLKSKKAKRERGSNIIQQSIDVNHRKKCAEDGNFSPTFAFPWRGGFSFQKEAPHTEFSFQSSLDHHQ
jgi:hypothetical protein